MKYVSIPWFYLSVALFLSSSQLFAAAELSINPFTLHSKAGAPLIIYLDFNGQTVQNSSLNGYVSLAGCNPDPFNLVIPPFSLDDEPSFSNEEKLAIIRTYSRIAEDFAPFEVDVTTQEPASEDDLYKTSSDDTHYGVRVVFGGNSNDFFCANMTSVGFSDSFGRYSATAPEESYDAQPTVVFEKNLNGDEKTMAETASREIGFALGLEKRFNLDGTLFAGGGTGLSSWAPIMGDGTAKVLTQWSKGEYMGADNTVDEMARIAQKIPYSLDEQGEDMYTAFVIPMVQDPDDATRIVFSRIGIIEKSTDKDVFAIWAGVGTVQLALRTLLVSQADPGTNLDAKIEVLDVGGNVVASSNLAGAQSEELVFNSDTNGKFYFVVLSGAAGEGYTQYGSVGKYNLIATFPQSTLPVPALPQPISYNVKGFFSPVDNMPTLNQAKAGRSIPVKFSLAMTNTGEKVTSLDILAAGYPKTQAITCTLAADTNVLGDEETLSNGGGLQYDAVADQYTYVLSTSKAWAGSCRQLVVKLKDGQIKRANFQFK